MESLLGLSASLHWAMGTGQFSFADLDSALLLKPAPVKSGITNSGPVYRLNVSVPGFGSMAKF